MSGIARTLIAFIRKRRDKREREDEENEEEVVKEIVEEDAYMFV